MVTGTSQGQCARTAAILIIGNEVLSGKITDQNSPFLLQELRALGVKVQRVLTVPDELDVIATEVKSFSDRYDFVFTSGGVGPTHDDVTMPAMAKAFGVNLMTHPDLLKLAQERLQDKLTEAALRMTMVPEGTELINAPQLIHPVVLLRNVYIFPGVPEYLRFKFNVIKERFREAPYHLVKIYTRQGEAVLAALLENTLTHFPMIDIGSYPRFDTDEYRVMLTLESKDREKLLLAREHLLTLMQEDALVRVCEA